MQTRRFDWKTFALIVGAALLGAAWATWNRLYWTTPPGYGDDEFRPLVWIIFATPFATFWGWFAARRFERWWAAFVCFCIYFFSPFVAARYESCVVVHDGFSLSSCFIETELAQQRANQQGHVIYFSAIVVIHLVAALVVALHRARNRSTIPEQLPIETKSQEPGARSQESVGS